MPGTLEVVEPTCSASAQGAKLESYMTGPGIRWSAQILRGARAETWIVESTKIGIVQVVEDDRIDNLLHRDAFDIGRA